MRGATTPRPYVSARGVSALRQGLSERDLAILRQVAGLRLMSADQIQAIHFPVEQHGSKSAATRARQRTLARLIRQRLLISLERRIGGVRAGSTGLILALDAFGQRVLALDGPRRRSYEPTSRFVDHTLAAAQLVVDLTLTERAGQLELLEHQAEPNCWREYADMGGRRLLRPDAFVVLGVGDYELRWFVEIDRATESLPVVLRKCRCYADYYQAGIEQAKSGGVFPRVVWSVPNEKRAEQVRRTINRDRSLPEGLFAVTTSQQTVPVLMALTNQPN